MLPFLMCALQVCVIRIPVMYAQGELEKQHRQSRVSIGGCTQLHTCALMNRAYVNMCATQHVHLIRRPIRLLQAHPKNK